MFSKSDKMNSFSDLIASEMHKRLESKGIGFNEEEERLIDELGPRDTLEGRHLDDEDMAGMSIREDSEHLDQLRGGVAAVEDIIEGMQSVLRGEKCDPSVEHHIKGKSKSELLDDLNLLKKVLMHLEPLVSKPRLSDYEGE